MLVYGDIERTEDACAIAAEIGDWLERYRQMRPNLERHHALVTAFIRAGELVQGLADAEFAKAGLDDVGERQDAGCVLLLALAKALIASWDSAFSHNHLETHQPLLQALSVREPIRTRQAEGYAFYALYPEAYIAAARQSGLGPDTTIIGIRSIGTGLGAVVAASVGAATSYNVRPTGHPFDRQVAIGDRLADRLLDSAGPYAIVDEGPGLSGSSFNGVADWLVARGVAEERIHFFPSHSGELGNAARADHRRRWLGAHKHVVSFDEIMGKTANPEHRLESWVSTAVGGVSAPLQDLSGGQWRRLHQAPGHRPPADAALESRKFLATAGDRRWLAKFVGLGHSGIARLQLAQELAAEGFAPPPLGHRHGFLITPWIAQLSRAPTAPPLDRVLDYLSFRASLPPTGPGAPFGRLYEMATHNIGQRLGDGASTALRAALGDPERLRPVPCCTDNRMHRWEWVHGAGGWYKLDGTDHHAAHDLVGCQDIAWDVAGAAVEFGLTEAEREDLARALADRIGRPIGPEFLTVTELCYLGFQIGLWTMALARNGEDEQARIQRLLSRYEHRLRRVLRFDLR
jgi:hypothetical protein